MGTFLANQITLTTEYLSETLNTRVGKALKEMKNLSSERILNKPIFQKVIQALGFTHLKGYTFPPFALIGRVLAKPRRDKCTLIIITPVWPSQPWHTQLLRMSIKDPIFIPPFPNLLTDPNQNQHPLSQNQTLASAA